MQWFISEIIPILHKKGFRFTLDIIGSWNSYDLKAAEAFEEIRMTGFIPDLAAHISGSIALIPIRIGSGMRMKALDAVAAQVPIITTTKGIEGIDLRNEEECLIADSPEAFFYDFHCFFYKLFDLIEFACFYKVAFYHPASAACKDLVACKIVSYILRVESACGHEFHPYVRSCDRFDVSEPASLLSREEFYDVKAVLDRLLYIARIRASRCDRDAFFHTVFNDFRVQSRAYDEFRSGCHRAVYLLCCQDRACSYEHVREFLRHDADGFFRCVCAECYLSARESAFAECLCQRLSVLGVIEDDNRNDAELFDLLLYFVHFSLSFVS